MKFVNKISLKQTELNWINYGRQPIHVNNELDFETQYKMPVLFWAQWLKKKKKKEKISGQIFKIKMKAIIPFSGK